MTDFPKRPELGQVWTPSDLALEMAKAALIAKPDISRVLDPACGPATFSRALHEAGAKDITLDCFDVDPRMTNVTKGFNREFGFSGSVYLMDYLLDQSLAETYDLVIMNPPYIRQEEIPLASKVTYHNYLNNALDVKIDRRANLFTLFLLKGIIDLAPGGILCAIVYAAITQSGYGKKTLSLLDRHAKLIFHKHILTPFDGVLVDAQILTYQKRQEVVLHKSATEPIGENGLVSLETLLETRRGTGLPLRKIFLAKPEDPFFKESEPFFVKQVSLNTLIIQSTHRAYLSDAKILQDWLTHQANKNQIVLPKAAIRRVTGDIVFNYYIRNSPRHLWNSSHVVISDNFYVSTTKEGFSPLIAWLLLNSPLYLERIMLAARNQGNGLLKLQLYEYKSAAVPDWRTIPKRRLSVLQKIAERVLHSDYETVKAAADKAIMGLFNA